MKITKIITNVESYDLGISKAELKEKIREASDGEGKLVLELGTVASFLKGVDYEDKVTIELDLEHIKILVIEEHEMTKVERKQATKQKK